MPEQGSPPALRWLIGVELAHYRKKAHLSLAALSARVDITKPKLGHLETGRYTQYPSDIAKILKACGAESKDIDRLNSLAARASEGSWLGAWNDVTPDWLRTFMGLEALAAREFIFEPIVLPGLLQTEGYARQVTAAASRVRADHAERIVDFRLNRARLLSKSDPLVVHAVVTVQALKLRIGDAKTLAAQYRHLLSLAELSNVTLQVVRPEDGLHGAATGQFVLLDFAEARSIAYVELQDGALYINDLQPVTTYRMSQESLQHVALPPEDSAILIESLVK